MRPRLLDLSAYKVHSMSSSWSSAPPGESTRVRITSIASSPPVTPRQELRQLHCTLKRHHAPPASWRDTAWRVRGTRTPRKRAVPQCVVSRQQIGQLVTVVDGGDVLPGVQQGHRFVDAALAFTDGGQESDGRVVGPVRRRPPRFPRTPGPFSNGRPGVHRRCRQLSFAVRSRVPSGRGRPGSREDTPWQS